MKRILLVILAVLIIAPALFAAYLWLTSASLQTLPALQDGDMVFHTDDTSQTLAIMTASGSFYTHTGIIKIKAQGEPYVVEAVGPVREIPLRTWLAKGVGGRLTILRVKDLTAEQARGILKAAKDYYGNPYDPFFTFGKDKIYCSELVYLAFKEGAGLELGRVQSVGELYTDNTAVRMLIDSRWKAYPECRKRGIDRLEICLPIIRQQTLITPYGLSQDSRLETVFSNY